MTETLMENPVPAGTHIRLISENEDKDVRGAVASHIDSEWYEVRLFTLSAPVITVHRRDFVVEHRDDLPKRSELTLGEVRRHVLQFEKREVSS
ncbi:MAG: hypothetical protein ABFD60_04315 [Bryobacteraceae bacterium]